MPYVVLIASHFYLPLFLPLCSCLVPSSFLLPLLFCSAVIQPVETPPKICPFFSLPVISCSPWLSAYLIGLLRIGFYAWRHFYSLLDPSAFPVLFPRLPSSSVRCFVTLGPSLCHSCPFLLSRLETSGRSPSLCLTACSLPALLPRSFTNVNVRFRLFAFCLCRLCSPLCPVSCPFTILLGAFPFSITPSRIRCQLCTTSAFW